MWTGRKARTNKEKKAVCLLWNTFKIKTKNNKSDNTLSTRFTKKIKSRIYISKEKFKSLKILIKVSTK